MKTVVCFNTVDVQPGSLVSSLLLPGIGSYPLIQSGERVSIALVEIGIKAKPKRRQLKNKQELLQEYWPDIIQTSQPLGWQPDIYRIACYYGESGEPTQNIPHISAEYNLINKHDLDSLTNQEIDEILLPFEDNFSVTDISPYKTRMRDTIKSCDPQKVYDALIYAPTGDGTIDGICGQVRGKLGEILALKAIRTCLPNTIHMIDNGELDLISPRYPDGTEIDAILVFYSKKPLYNLVKNLRKTRNMNIKTNLS